jgi:hypothetical protein
VVRTRSIGGMLLALTLVSRLAHESHQLLLLVDLRHDVCVWERAMEWVGMSVVDVAVAVAVAVDVVVVLDMAMVSVPPSTREDGWSDSGKLGHPHPHPHPHPPQSHHPQHHHVS